MCGSQLIGLKHAFYYITAAEKPIAAIARISVMNIHKFAFSFCIVRNLAADTINHVPRGGWGSTDASCTSLVVLPVACDEAKLMNRRV